MAWAIGAPTRMGTYSRDVPPRESVASTVTRYSPSTAGAKTKVGLVRVEMTCSPRVTVHVSDGATPVEERASTSRAMAQSAGMARFVPDGAPTTSERLETPETSTLIGREAPAFIVGEV